MKNQDLDLKVIKNCFSSRTNKVIPTKCTEKYLKDIGLFDYVVERFEDVDSNTSLLEIVHRIAYGIEKFPVCKYCNENKCLFDMTLLTYADYCDNSDCIVQHYGKCKNVEIPKTIDDQTVKDLIFDSSRNRVKQNKCIRYWLAAHGLYDYIRNRFEDCSDYVEASYRICHGIEEVPTCPVCGKKKLKFKSLKRGYANQCDTYTCTLKNFEANHPNVKQLVNLKDQDIIDTFVKKVEDGKIKSLQKGRVCDLWIYEHGYRDYLNNRFPDSESLVETISRIFYGIEERPVCKCCGGKVDLYNYRLGKENVFRQYCSNECYLKEGRDMEKVKKSRYKTLIKKISDKCGYKCEYTDDTHKFLYVYGCCHQHDPFKISMSTFNNRYNEPTVTLCPVCNPERNTETSIETIVKNILLKNNIDFVQHSRTVLRPKELDFWIPAYNIGIECNGLWWHSGEIQREKGFWKLEEAGKLGIRLLTFWEDDIRNYPEKIEHIINNTIQNVSKIPSVEEDSIKIKEISIENSKEFIKENTLKRYCNSSVRVGVFKNDELIGIANAKKKDDTLLTSCVSWKSEREQVLKGIVKYIKHHYNSIRKIDIFVDRETESINDFDCLDFIKLKETQSSYTWFDPWNPKFRISKDKIQGKKIEKLNKCYDLGKDHIRVFV